MASIEDLRNEEPEEAQEMVAALFDAFKTSTSTDNVFAFNEVGFIKEFPFIQAIIKQYRDMEEVFVSDGASEDQINFTRSGVILTCASVASYLISKVPDFPE